MDRKLLVKKLKNLFCHLNKEDKKYIEVWLSDVNFGGLYQPADKYVLNVKAEHVLGRCTDEISQIIDILDEYAKDELQHIWRVAVYDATENIHCVSDDLVVYNEATSC